MSRGGGRVGTRGVSQDEPERTSGAALPPRGPSTGPVDQASPLRSRGLLRPPMVAGPAPALLRSTSAGQVSPDRQLPSLGTHDGSPTVTEPAPDVSTATARSTSATAR